MARTWRNDYLEALQARDATEKASLDILTAYTKLADEFATLYKTTAEQPAKSPTARDVSNPPAAAPSKTSRVPPSLLGGTSARTPSPATATRDEGDARLRADLIAANRTVHDLNTQILALRSELEASRGDVASRDDKLALRDAAVARLQAEKLSVARKLRDRDSELREKDRLVTDIQDENVSLEMQLNVSDERAQKLERENKDLVDRWMRRVGREAEAMNQGSGWQ